MKKKLAYLFILSLLSVTMLAGCGNKNKNNPNFNPENYLSGTYYAVMDVANYGSVYMELYADIAPASVTNFVNLVKEGFYDGLTFHRVVSGFMVQGGDPKGNGSGGSTYTVPGEFYFNGFETNTLSHVRGTLSMARTEDPDSASSQFFIMQQDNNDLDGYYAAFGRVISGMSVIDSICKAVKPTDNDGNLAAADQPVITSIKLLEKDEMPAPEAEESERPEPTTQISIVSAGSDNLPTVGSWVINEDGASYLLSSTGALASLSLYKVDLTKGVTYNGENMLARTSDIGAGELVSMKINVTNTAENYPDQLLIAEEPNGALRMYLLSLDSSTNTAYLIPFGN